MASAAACLLSRHASRCCRRWSSAHGRRTFLSEAYRCQDAWDQIRNSSQFKSVNMDKFYVALDKNFQTDGKILPVDIDIFALCASSEQQLDDLQDLVHRFRRTPLTADALPSTSHAVVRAFLTASPNRQQRLIDMLEDRMNYGIFLDHYTANMLMDHFIKVGNNRDAAKVAVQLMLQEDWEHPISRALALYSCYLYVEHPVPEPWHTAEPDPPDDGETVYVRVKYLTNEWTDDHFDLREPSDQLGKTLAWLGRASDGVAGCSCELLGWTMYRRWDALRQCAARVQATEGVCQDTVGRVCELLSAAGDQCPEAGELVTLVGSLPVQSGQLRDQLAAAVRTAVESQQSADVAQLGALYTEWDQQRQQALEEQRQAADSLARQRVLEERRQYLRERERLLYFFENEEQLKAEVDRQWNKPPPAKPPLVQRILRKQRRVQEDYIPPSV